MYTRCFPFQHKKYKKVKNKKSLLEYIGARICKMRVGNSITTNMKAKMMKQQTKMNISI